MLSLTANDIMTRDVITIRKGASIEEALKQMADHRISGLPVVGPDGCLEGIITESDVLLKGQYAPPETHQSPRGLFAPVENGVEEAYRRAQAETVEDAMNRKVLTFREDSLVVDIARAMIEHAVNRVPIIRDCKVVGIVSRRDVIRAMAKSASKLGDFDRDNEIRAGKVIEL